MSVEGRERVESVKDDAMTWVVCATCQLTSGGAL